MHLADWHEVLRRHDGVHKAPEILKYNCEETYSDNPSERPTRVASNIIDCSTEMDATATSIESTMDVRRSLTLQFFGFAQSKYLNLQENAMDKLCIMSKAFDDVRLLNLANNQLSYLNGDEFNNLGELRVLILSDIRSRTNLVDFKCCALAPHAWPWSASARTSIPMPPS